jgi:flagellar biosynthesis protein FlhF
LPHPLTGAAMSPQRSAALRTLNELGIEPSLAIAIADSLPGDADQEKARLLPLGLLARRLPVHPADRILEGGIIALVGPTGVGKTTTLAKLAARFAARFGTRDLALLSTDHYRVGAQEQLFTYGRLLGVPVQTVDSAQALREGLLRFADRKLVLIDTAGMAPRDRQLTQQLAELHAAGRPIERWLVLSATTQASDQDEILRCYGPAQPKAAVLTKVDEATRLGGALSTLIRHRLPLTYVCDGQQVPEDIRIARADQLVLRAMQAARRAAAVLAQPEVKHAQA